MQEKCEIKFPVDKYSFICLNTLYLHAKMGIVALPKTKLFVKGDSFEYELKIISK